MPLYLETTDSIAFLPSRAIKGLDLMKLNYRNRLNSLILLHLGILAIMKMRYTNGLSLNFKLKMDRGHTGLTNILGELSGCTYFLFLL